MIRRLMITVAAMGLGIAAVGAQQQDAAAVLQTAMRTNGRVIYGDFGKMAKGETPYSQQTVDAGLAVLEDFVKKAPTLFPESAKPGVAGAKYVPSPKIWAPENKADFQSKMDAFAKALTAAKSTIKDVDTLRSGRETLNNACNGCHDTYQARGS